MNSQFQSCCMQHTEVSEKIYPLTRTNIIINRRIDIMKFLQEKPKSPKIEIKTHYSNKTMKPKCGLFLLRYRIKGN